MSKKSRRKQKELKEQSDMVNKILGEMIDTPLDEFKRQVEEQKLPLGLTKTASNYLKLEYNRVAQAKDDMNNAIDSGRLDIKDEVVKKNVEDLYLLLQNIENKVLFLDERALRLMSEV